MESSRAAPVVIAAVLLLVGGYIGSYFALVRAGALQFDGRISYLADYRVGGLAVHTFFQPIHKLDRYLRPHVWHPELPTVMPQWPGPPVKP